MSSRWLVAALLAALPAAPGQARDLAAAPDAGAQAYARRCATCHGRTAEGSSGVFPSLRHAGELARTPQGRRYLSDVLSFGVMGPIEVEGRRYAGVMPGLRQALGPVEKAAILNYLLELDPRLPRPPLFDAPELAASAARAPKTPAQVARTRPKLSSP